MCDLLIRYYQCDYVQANLQDLQKKKKEIEKFIAEISSEEKVDSSAESSLLLDRIENNIMEYAASLTSSAQVRQYVSKLITNRTYWNYSRTLANSIIICLQDSGFLEIIEEINEKMGHHYRPHDFMKLLEKPQPILRVLSFTLYAVRIMINLLTIIKHVIHAAMSEELSSKKILLQEIEKRIFLMANDIAWGTVNLLSNYNEFFHISAWVVAQLNLIFLAFDLALFIVHWSYELNQYNNIVQQLTLQKNTLNSLFELAVINRQLDILNDEWEAQCAYYKINIVAANLFVITFGATLLVSGPLAFACLAAMSMFSNALYNTSEEYKKYKQANIAVQREIANSKIVDDEHHRQLLQELNRECSQANIFFWKSLAFNAGATALIITATAISWPIACLLAVSYIAYRLNDTYQKNTQAENSKRVTHDIYRLFSDKPVVSSSALVNQPLLCSTLCN